MSTLQWPVRPVARRVSVSRPHAVLWHVPQRGAHRARHNRRLWYKADRVLVVRRGVTRAHWIYASAWNHGFLVQSIMHLTSPRTMSRFTTASPFFSNSFIPFLSRRTRTLLSENMQHFQCASDSVMKARSTPPNSQHSAASQQALLMMSNTIARLIYDYIKYRIF